MDDPFRLYSVARRLRCGPPGDVREALLDVRERTLALADAYEAALGPGLPVPHRPTLNPPRWEWGHIAWFQEWWVARNPERAAGVRAKPDALRPPSIEPQADAWYDSSRVAHPTRWALPLPSAGATRRFLDGTLEATLALLDAMPPDASDDALYFFRLVALHEAMHAEAATYMARSLGVPVDVPALPPPPAGEIDIQSQRFRLGAARPGFAFDNELAAHDVEIAAFRIDARPVRESDFQAFLRDTGQDDRRRERGEADPHASALHLTADEAQAWCRWAGRRLPTEAEWECAALTAPAFAWGESWEWTASPFEPYPGFVPHPYRDYSQPWFGTRVVLRGACAATSKWLAHPRYRNFFEPHRSDIFSGFRSCAAA